VLHGYTAPEDAIATYTTAHKAKGREADQVILADDFGSNYKKGEWVGMPVHDENLLYVAVTRAQRVLQINTTVAEILDKHGVQYIISMQDGEAEYNAVARQYDVLSEPGITEDSPPWN
jgi:superfamily I DNA/RNA helicase